MPPENRRLPLGCAPHAPLPSSLLEKVAWVLELPSQASCRCRRAARLLRRLRRPSRFLLWPLLASLLWPGVLLGFGPSLSSSCLLVALLQGRAASIHTSSISI